MARREADRGRRSIVDGKTTTLTGEDLARWKYQRYMQDYLACVQSVDDNVGRLLDFLKESGLERDTIVVYTSDQGFFLGDHGLYDKRFMYEESLRMPLLVRWPAVDAARLAGGGDGAQRGLRADLPGGRRRGGARHMQGRSLAAAAPRRDARGLAHRDLLPLLPRPRAPQHARPLRRPHGDAQAHLLLEEGPVGAVRPALRPRRAAATSTASRARRRSRRS